MKSKAKPMLVGLILSNALACGGEIREMHVEHYRTSCVGLVSRLCYLVDGDFLYSSIQGWNYSWGYEYDLRVAVEEIDNPPADGSSLRYTLVSEVRRTRAGADKTFTIPIFDPKLITAGKATTFSIWGERDFDCAANSLCDDIESALENSAPCIDLELSHPTSDLAPLRLESVKPSTGRECSGGDGVSH